MTNQEAFNLAYIGVSKQGKRSKSVGGSCAFRGVDGTKCALGHCLSDAQVGNLDIVEGDSSCKVAGLLGINTELASDMMNAHDAYEDGEVFLKNFQGYMGRIAYRFNLTVPEVV